MNAAVADNLAARSLEQLLATPVTGGAKRAQAPTEAPSMVSVVTADEICHFGWRRLDEARNALRGIHITYDRSYAYVGLRGFGRQGDYNSRVLMLIDGIPINDGVYDQAPVGNDFPLDLALIERIEYVPGPGSALYGGNAFLGVINVVSRNAAGLGTEVFDRRHAPVAGTEFSAAYPGRMLEPMPTLTQDLRSWQLSLERRL